MKEESKLDNPVWYSLLETHREFAIDYGVAKFYQPEVCPFGGFSSDDHLCHLIGEHTRIAKDFFIVGQKPPLPATVTMLKEIDCLQMTLSQPVLLKESPEVKLISPADFDALNALVTLVQPGYFKQRTTSMGDYFGIFRDGQLICVAGERMKMNGFSEISAVITRPGFTGQGYAKQLVAHLVARILAEHKLPFLHVAKTNTGAIGLYEKLGFVTRRSMSFWSLSRRQTAAAPR